MDSLPGLAGALRGNWKFINPKRFKDIDTMSKNFYNLIINYVFYKYQSHIIIYTRYNNSKKDFGRMGKGICVFTLELRTWRRML